MSSIRSVMHEVAAQPGGLDPARRLENAPFPHQEQTIGGAQGVFLEHQGGTFEVRHPGLSHHFLNFSNSTNLHRHVRCGGATSKLQGRSGWLLDLIPAGHAYAWEWSSEAGRSCHLLLSPKRLAKAAEAAEIDPARVELRTSFAVEDEPMMHVMSAVGGRVRTGLAKSRLFDDALIQTACAWLLEHCAVAALPFQVVHGGLAIWRLRRVQEYVRANLSRDFSLEDLAGVAGLSTAHFSRLFKQSTGLSPYRYVVKERIELAAQLLQRHHTTVLDISIECGFKTQAHFAAAFRRETGATPLEWRHRR